MNVLKPHLRTTVETLLEAGASQREIRRRTGHWTALTRFVDDGRLSLDNNLVERQIRDIALGRKNYLFAGSHRAAERTAALYSLLRTAALQGVPPLPYLTDVLTKLAAGWDPDRIDELLPDRWKASLSPPDGSKPAPP